ncbi:MAG: hypothetical protein IPQ07_26700 [Myxococcales bacterium]|nr:hypothetical protein [Myxococcales bacterium]
MRVLLALSSLAAGCGFSAPAVQTGDDTTLPEAGMGSGSDAAIDAQIDAVPIDGCTSFSTVINTCTVGQFGPPLIVTGNRQYDTDTFTLSDDPGGGNATTPTHREEMIGTGPVTFLVTGGFTLALNAKLRVVGSRAFGVISSGSITLVGNLDASNGGAGARTAAMCQASAGVAGANNNAMSGGASGGGGGGYGAAGAKGAKGDNNGAQLNGGNGGTAITLAANILGGCPGGKGGNDGAGGGTGGNGGPGGGAVFMTGALDITISGSINAGGGGGARGNAIDGGAGGGGSGGQILLEAQTLVVSGAVAANGGGGGGGAGNSSGANGQNGQASATAASGGNNGGAGSAGSNGGAKAQPQPPQPGDAGGGGGGGGGGVGFVTLKHAAPIVSGVVSPNATTWP